MVLKNQSQISEIETRDLLHQMWSGAESDHWEKGKRGTERGHKISPLSDIIHEGRRVGVQGVERHNQ